MKKTLFAFLFIIFLPLGFLFYLLSPFYGNLEGIKRLPKDMETGVFKSRLSKSLLEAFHLVPDSTIVALYEHIPIIFSTEGACYFRSNPSDPYSNSMLFPGRKFPANREFVCRGNQIIKTTGETSAFLTPSLGKYPPHPILYFGSLEIHTSNEPLFLSTRSITMLVRSFENSSVIMMNRDGTNDSIFCVSGKTKFEVIANFTVEGEPTYLGSQNCDLEITNTSGTVARKLKPGETVKGNDLDSKLSSDSVNFVSNDVTTSNNQSTTTSPSSLIQIKIAPKGSKGDILLFSYTLPMNGPAVCNLKTGASENGPFSDAYQFQAPSKAGTLDLQKGFSAFFLSLHCTDGKNKFLSNVIPPKK